MRHHFTLPVLGLAFLALSAGGCGNGKRIKLSGSGSSFVKPIMDRWVEVYTGEHGGEINYQAQGSGAGVNQMIEEAVNFGCTDAFLTEDQLDQAAQEGGAVLHVPLVLGAIVPAYNLEGVDQPLRFTGPVLADIFRGRIKKWNDAALQELNPGAPLPDREISVIYRADSSGSTFIFTEYLSKVSPEWKKEVGFGTRVKWPAGRGEPQTAGVAGAIARSPGSIGYVELYYALLRKGQIQVGAVRNRAGKFIPATLEGVSKAADASLAEVPDDLRFSLTDAPGEESYPISGTTWAVLYRKQPENTGRQLVEFLTWATHDGQQFAPAMHYAPLPSSLVKRIDEKLKTLSTGQ